jgi:hypothetical protein
MERQVLMALLKENNIWEGRIVMSPSLDSLTLQLEVTLWVYVNLARGVNGG